MANIIDVNYFVGQIAIPFDNVDPDEFTSTYIAVYEREILIRFLGYDLYKRFTEGLAQPSPAQIWLDLRDGVEYTVDVNSVSHLIKWNGLANSDKVSLIAYYVYYKWLSQNDTQVTGTGVGRSTKENAEIYDPNFKLVQAWNNVLELSGLNWYPKTEPTLYNFINDNKETYLPDEFDPWIFKPIEPANFLGI